MNSETEKRGIDAVIAYEFLRDRVAVRVHGCGYDLKSESTKKEKDRHIEVKATRKTYFTSRWLEPLEWQQAQEDPLFYLYLVTNVYGSPRVFEYDREKLRSHASTQVHHYNYKFSRSAFK